MLNKPKGFKGGYSFKKPEGKCSDTIKKAPLPSKVWLPLKLRFGSHITPLVKKGDIVKAGQVIARSDDTISTPAVASISGVVEDILNIDYFYGRVDAIVISSNGDEGYEKLTASSADWRQLSHEKLNELLYLSGASALGKSGIPTIFKSSPARPSSIQHLIITTFESGPYSLHERQLLRGRENDFYSGLEILKRILPNARVTVVVDRKDRIFLSEIINVIRRATSVTRGADWIFIQPVDNKYPLESEDMLARIIAGRKIPMGGLGVDIGILVLDLHDVLKVYDAVGLGIPFIERIVNVSGSACRENTFLKIRIGSRAGDILKDNIKEEKFRLIFGNALTGLRQEDFNIPVGRSVSRITLLRERDTRRFLAFLRPGAATDSYSNTFLSSTCFSRGARYDTNMNGEPRPCIQCGWCEDACPAGIIPHLLNKQVEHNMCEELQMLGIFDCIDCGLCSYVCPCKIPIARHLSEGKKKLIEEGCNIPMVKTKESEEVVRTFRGRMPI